MTYTDIYNTYNPSIMPVPIDYTNNFNFNRIHKRFMVLYDSNDMRKVWKKVRSSYKKHTKQELPKRFKKHPEIWQNLNEWIESCIQEQVEDGSIEDIAYLNKADLIARGWDAKLLNLLYPKPDKQVYLGRGRYAYYYHGGKIAELEDSEEFIEYIANKLERKRIRDAKSLAKNKSQSGFGSEFVR